MQEHRHQPDVDRGDDEREGARRNDAMAEDPLPATSRTPMPIKSKRLLPFEKSI
jgi:hypothetical protein